MEMMMEEPERIKARRKRRSLAWRFFVPEEGPDPDRGSAKCSLCGVIIKTMNGCTTPLNRHLTSKHGKAPTSNSNNGEGEEFGEDEEGEGTGTDNVGHLFARTVEPRKPSHVWEHFTRESKEHASCKHCNMELKTPKGTTSSLARHLESQHDIGRHGDGGGGGSVKKAGRKSVKREVFSSEESSSELDLDEVEESRDATNLEDDGEDDVMERNSPGEMSDEYIPPRRDIKVDLKKVAKGKPLGKQNAGGCTANPLAGREICFICNSQFNPESVPQSTEDEFRFLFTGVLEIPTGKSLDYLEQLGRPEKWIPLCGSCHSHLQDALLTRRKITRLQVHLENRQRQLLECIKTKAKKWRKDIQKYPKRARQVVQEIRRFVQAGKYPTSIISEDDEINVITEEVVGEEQLLPDNGSSSSSSNTFEVNDDDDGPLDPLQFENESQLIQPIRKQTSLVWRYFIRVHSRESATCRLCKVVLRTPRGTTSSLARHLRSCHNMSREDVRSARNNRKRVTHQQGENDSLNQSKKSRMEMSAEDGDVEYIPCQGQGKDPQSRITKLSSRPGPLSSKKGFGLVRGKYKKRGTDQQIVSMPILCKSRNYRYDCPNCPSVKGYQMVRFALHLANHLRRPFQCTICSEFFPDDDALRETHWQEKHSNSQHDPDTDKFIRIKISPGKIWTCEFCHDGFHSEDDRYNHELRCLPPMRMRMRNSLPLARRKPHQCHSCQLRFRDVAEWRFHRVLYHPQDDSRSCYYCDKSFSSVTVEGVETRHDQKMVDHMNSAHKTLRLYDECERCGIVFNNREENKQHMLEKHEIPEAKLYSCIVCGVHHSYMTGLRRHICNTHFQSSTKVCDQCGAKFLYDHTLHHHKFQQHQIIPEGREVLSCPEEECGFQSIIPQNIKKHIWQVHNKDKNSFICGYCGKAFRLRSNLKGHLEIHTNKETKPYQCEVCGVAYAVKNYLAIHKRMAHQEGKGREVIRRRYVYRQSKRQSGGASVGYATAPSEVSTITVSTEGVEQQGSPQRYY